MNVSFKQYADQLDYIEVLKITISPKGEYRIPSEKDGKIACVEAEERARLREFLLEFCQRLECPNPEHISEPQRAKRKTG
jgi:hypothetical protein